MLVTKITLKILMIRKKNFKHIQIYIYILYFISLENQNFMLP